MKVTRNEQITATFTVEMTEEEVEKIIAFVLDHKITNEVNYFVAALMRNLRERDTITEPRCKSEYRARDDFENQSIVRCVGRLGHDGRHGTGIVFWTDKEESRGLG